LKKPDFRQVFSRKSGGCRLGEEAIFFSSLITPEAGNQGNGAGSERGRREQLPRSKGRETGTFRERFNDFKPLRWMKVSRRTA
jgi:hypothetical protein